MASRGTDEDGELVRRAQGGDTTAFDELVLKHTARLYGLIYHMTSHREDADDLLQEVFAKAYRALRRFRGQARFSTWIHSIALNMTLNHLKKRKRRQEWSLADMNPAVGESPEFLEASRAADPERAFDLRALQETLNEALQRLSHDHRAVVTLHDIQGMPQADISRVLGVSSGTVRSRLFYARQQLQISLSDFLPH
ncbi:MAG: sigma-70 family RNA polymerase sigma factor [Verrucomicrobiota bacterium]